MVLQSSKDKVKEISEMLHNETILPAQEEAQKIIAEAKSQADAIVAKANEDADDILQALKKELEKTQKVSDSSIELSIKQGLARLKQLVMELFSEQMQSLVDSKMSDVDVMSKLIDALVGGIDKSGLDSDLSLVIGENVSKDDVIGALSGGLQKRLEKGGIEVGNFKAGLIVKLIDKKMAIEMTDKTAVELLSKFVSDDLKSKLFD